MLRRLKSKISLVRPRRGYRSRFGGLWIDARNGEAELERKRALARLSPLQAERLRFWREHGFLILEKAVSPEDADDLVAETEEIWRKADPALKVDVSGEVRSLDPAVRGPRCKLLDLHVFSPAARRILFAPAIRDFLATLFEDDILAFQSLYFEYGSEQPMHQDSAYVVVTSPMEIAASWVALEDIRPGSGELTYYDGSHRIPEFLFKGRFKNFNRERDGDDVHRRYLDALHERSHELGLELVRFLPKKGDALIWSADLVHGGSPVTDPGITRRSLVTHYCPGRREPYYFAYRRDRRSKVRFDDHALYASSHYALD